MTMTDPIADLLTRIRNGLMSNKIWIDVPSSNMKKRITLILKEESYIENFTSICPGVTICGNVVIGELTFIGANSTIIHGKIIGENCIVGAGTVVIRNVGDNSKIVGNPGRII